MVLIAKTPPQAIHHDGETVGNPSTLMESGRLQNGSDRYVPISGGDKYMPTGPEANGQTSSPGARSAGLYQSIDRYHPTIDSSPGIWCDRGILPIASKIARLNCVNWVPVTT
jgi:hypothetical protein